MKMMHRTMFLMLMVVALLFASHGALADKSVPLPLTGATLTQQDGVTYLDGTAYTGVVTAKGGNSASPAKNGIVVESGTHYVTLSNAYISPQDMTQGIDILPGATLHLQLKGESTIDATYAFNSAAIRCQKGATLYIYSEKADDLQSGKLVAKSSPYYAGIGGGGGSAGTIVICGGTIEAYGGSWGAGIGGGFEDDGGIVTIYAGKVTAKGGNWGAGIGGGAHGNGGKVTIAEGADVTAIGDRYQGAESIGHGSETETANPSLGKPESGTIAYFTPSENPVFDPTAPAAPADPQDGRPVKMPDMPKTGDGSMLTLWLAAAVLSLLGLAACHRQRTHA